MASPVDVRNGLKVGIRPADDQRREYAQTAYQNSRTVVFGIGVLPGNLHWVSSTEIEDRSTGSRIRFVDEPCVNFVAVEPGTVPRP